MPPQQPNQYDFIMQSQPKRGPAILQNPRNRMLISIGFVLGIILLVLLAFSIIRGGGTTNDTYVSLVSYQTELQRLAAFGESSDNLAVRNQTTTINAVMTTDLAATTAYIQELGSSISPEQSIAARDTTRDTQIEASRQVGDYDEVLAATLADVARNYLSLLETATTENPDANGTALLERLSNNITTLEIN